MRSLLLRLSLTSSEPAVSLDSSSGGGSDRHFSDRVLADGEHDTTPPETYYRRLFRQAETDDERRSLVDAVEAKLDGLLHSHANFDVPDEPPDELYDRIVLEGDGHPARAVANNLKTTVAIVYRARRERGREEAKGRPVEDLGGAPTEVRRRRVRELAREYAAESPALGPRAVSRALTVPYSTVVDDLES